MKRTFKILSPSNVSAPSCTGCDKPFDGSACGYETAQTGFNPDEYRTDLAGTFCGDCVRDDVVNFHVYIADTEAPADVDDIERFWSEGPPPAPSPKLVYWLQQYAAGWRPDRALQCMGYYEAAEFWGIYIWEWFEVLSRVLWPERQIDASVWSWLAQHGVTVGSE